MSEQENKSAMIRNFVAAKLEWLHKMPENAYRAELANLRRGAGKKPGDLPELWGTILQNMPEEFYGKNGEASKEEWAVYTVLTTFAVHQQGHSQSEWMSTDCPFGSAVCRLAPNDDEDELERVLRRFNAFATSADIEEASHYLRGLAQLLRGADMPFDYPALAVDLYYFQFPESAPKFRLKWGQDFYRVKKKENTEENTKQ